MSIVSIGTPIWKVDRPHGPEDLAGKASVEVAVVGGGFCGLATAAAAAEVLGPDRVCLLEAGLIGEGASGRTGGITLNEVAGGSLPGTEAIVASFAERLNLWNVDCDFRPCEMLRLSHRTTKPHPHHPLDWRDLTALRVCGTEPGGDLDAGKLITGLWRKARSSGARIFEKSPVVGFESGDRARLIVGSGRRIDARSVVVATNARGPLLGKLNRQFLTFETFALATEPLSPGDFRSLGWDPSLPFYTVDLPYLWGRSTVEGRVIMGTGLKGGKPGRREPNILKRLVRRVRSLHPRFRDVHIESTWSGPMAMTRDFYPRILPLDAAGRVWTLGGWCGHGVCLSVETGARLGEVLASGVAPEKVFGEEWRSRAEFGGPAARAVSRIGFSVKIALGSLFRQRM